MFAIVAMLLCGCGGGQEDASGPSDKPEPSGPPAIMECIPAGATFYVSKSLSKTFDNAETFMLDVGVSQMTGFGVSRPGDGRKRDSAMMMRVKGMLRLGEGFDPDGAAAAVFVSPQSAGIDVGKLLEAARTRAEADGGAGRYGIDYGREVRLGELQAYVLCGKLENMFVGREATKQGGVTVLAIGPSVEAYAAQKGPYVIYCRSRAGLNAILNAKKTVADELSSDEIAMVNDSDITAHFDIESFRPIVSEFMDIAAGYPAEDLDEPLATVVGLLVKMAGAFIGQLDAATIGVTLGVEGVNIDSICTAKPGSAAAKVFQAESDNVGGVNAINAVPSLPYVAVMGVEGWYDNPAFREAIMEMSKSMMGPDAVYKMDEKTKARMLELIDQIVGTVTGVQVVLGGAPVGKGAVGMSEVVRCKDSAGLRRVLPEAVELTNGVLAGMEMPAGSPKIAITYAKDAEMVNGLSVDVMEIALSGLPQGDTEQLPAMLKKFLGEDKIRILVAAPDAKTLVVTAGGSIDGLKEALKVADGTGPIPSDPGVKTAMRSLPDNPSAVALFNVRNLTNVIRDVMEAFEASPKTVAIVPSIDCKTPIAFGMQAKGATLHTALHAPKPLIKDVLQAIMVSIARAEQIEIKPSK
jgi:hypothetical protein